LGAKRGWTGHCDQYIRVKLNKFGGETDEPLRLFRRETILQLYVSTFNVAEIGKSFS